MLPKWKIICVLHQCFFEHVIKVGPTGCWWTWKFSNFPSASDHLRQSAEAFSVSCIFQEVPRLEIKSSGLNCLWLSLLFPFIYTFYPRTGRFLLLAAAPGFTSWSHFTALLCQLESHQLQDKFMRIHHFPHPLRVIAMLQCLLRNRIFSKDLHMVRDFLFQAVFAVFMVRNECHFLAAH